MKHALFALSAAVVLSGCANVRVAHTDVASGATNPKAIYIRSYLGDDATFTGHQAQYIGERPIRRSMAPAEFSQVLKEEMEKLAPARVLEPDEVPEKGWLIETDLQTVDGGKRLGRGSPIGIFGVGKSEVNLHVRVTDLEGKHRDGDAKKEVTSEVAKTVAGTHGPVIYEFDLAGGSRGSGKLGSIHGAGLGEAARFDYKNAAERVLMALSVDPHRYGVRTSPGIR